MQEWVYHHHMYMCAACALFAECVLKWHTLLYVVHRHEVTLRGNNCDKFVPSSLILPFPRFAVVLMVVTMITGMLMWAGPQSASAKQAQQLSTCLNLATGANRVLVRGACDSVLEMTQVWDQVAADEPVGKTFSARTLAHAVL